MWIFRLSKLASGGNTGVLLDLDSGGGERSSDVDVCQRQCSHSYGFLSAQVRIFSKIRIFGFLYGFFLKETIFIGFTH